MRRKAILVGLVLAAAACASREDAGDDEGITDGPPQDACTLAAPFPGLTARLEPASGTTLPNGVYDVTVTADGQTFVLHPNVTGPSTGTCGAGQCAAEAIVDSKHLFAEVNLSGGFGLLRVGYREDGGPSTIGLDVRLGATVYTMQTLMPTYVPREVNGPGCGVTHQAMVTITLAAP